MGLDFASLFGLSGDAANQGMADVTQIGGNAGLGYLEGQGVDIIENQKSVLGSVPFIGNFLTQAAGQAENILKGDQANSDQRAQAAVTSALSSPSNPTGFGAYLTNIAQGPVLKQYGLYVAAGVGIFVLIFMWRK